jgi:hypothetical protein
VTTKINNFRRIDPLFHTRLIDNIQVSGIILDMKTNKLSSAERNESSEEDLNKIIHIFSIIRVKLTTGGDNYI